MPRTFNEMVKKGARVRTKQLPHGRYVRIAYLDGKSAMGSVKKKKETWVAKLKRGVKAEFASQKKKVADTVRTKDTQHQLKKAGVTFKTDVQKAEEKRKRNK